MELCLFWDVSVVGFFFELLFMFRVFLTAYIFVAVFLCSCFSNKEKREGREVGDTVQHG